MLLRVELLICLGPTFVYLPTAVIVAPHQLRLAIGENVATAWLTLSYYVGIGCLLVGVLSVWRWLRARTRPMPPLLTICMLTLGMCAILLGPAATFAHGGFEDYTTAPIVTLIFVALPLACVLHLAVLARQHLLGGDRDPSD